MPGLGPVRNPALSAKAIELNRRGAEAQRNAEPVENPSNFGSLPDGLKAGLRTGRFACSAGFSLSESLSNSDSLSNGLKPGLQTGRLVRSAGFSLPPISS